MELPFKLFNKRNTFLIVIVLVLAICFETAQQLFYINKFELYQGVGFFYLLKNQLYRWLIWFFCGIPLLYLIKKDIHKSIQLSLIFKYTILLLLLVLINIFLISIFSFYTNSESFSLSKFFGEYMMFFIFQKAPIYTLGYIAVTIIIFLSYSKELLSVEVQELIELKKTNDKVYQKLIASNSDKTQVLNIKIGNKRKIIPIEKITFIAADDYCVRVNTTDSLAYSMRISLKSLENKLGNNFLRVHRNSIVNMKMVKEFIVNSKPYLILNNDQKVYVSKSNLKEVKSFLK